jgi:hypothetical protein
MLLYNAQLPWCGYAALLGPKTQDVPFLDPWVHVGDIA